jgi:protein phosphatase
VVTFAGASHIGRQRRTQEDRFVISRELDLCAVADGVSSRPRGEHAAQLALDTVVSELARDPDPTPTSSGLELTSGSLVRAVSLANDVVFKTGKQPGYHGMTTTLAVVWFRHGSVSVAHVGDSRVYRWRQGSLTCLTEDHSVIETSRRQGTPLDDAQAKLVSGWLLQAIGHRATVSVTTRRPEPCEDHDVYLVCSDGLWNTVPCDTLESTIANTTDLPRACDRLIGLANEAGGPDNIAVILARWNTGEST